MKNTLACGTIALLVLALTIDRSFAQTAEELYQKGIQLEEVKGELEKAIEVYKTLIDKHAPSKQVAAKALLHLGNCYEKSGKGEARKAYERIVREYADQQSVAAEARTRLAMLTKTENGREKTAMTTRQVWAGEGVDIEGKISSDGRYLSFTDWSTGDIAVRDLQEGVSRRLTHKGDWSSQAYADFSTISPDGKEVAYIWYDGKQCDLRVVGTDGSEPRVIYQNDEVPWFWPHAWTPDKKFIATTFYRKDRTNQIALVSTSDRSVRILKSFDWRSPGNLSVSPDGRWIAYSFAPKEDDKQQDIFLLATDGSENTVLVQHPSNDDSPVWSRDGRSILFCSDRSISPGLWLLRVANGRGEGNPELIKANIGNIFPLGFTEKGSFVYGIMGGGNDIYAVDFDPTKGELISQPKHLSEMHVGFSSAPDWSPDGNSLAYVVDSKSGFGFAGRAIVVKSLKTEKMHELPHEGFDVVGFALKWWPNGNSLLVSGRLDSAGKPPRFGLFQVDAHTGSGKFLDVRTSQSSEGHGGFGWHSDGKSIFYSRDTSDTGRAKIVRRDLSTGKEQDIFNYRIGDDLRFMSLSPDGKEIACWNIIKGTKSLLLIPTDGGAPREILKGTTDALREVAGTPAAIDWTPDGKYIVFGKRVSRDQTEFWRIALEGGEPQKIGIVNQRVHDVVVHPGGKRIAFSTRDYKPEVWAMENFLSRFTVPLSKNPAK